MQRSSGMPTGNRATQRPAQGILTRAQRKTGNQEEKTKTKTPKITKESIEKEIKAKPGWNSLKHIEMRLKDLEKKYNETNKKTKRNQINMMVDVYEKRAKALNVEIVERVKNNLNSSRNNIYTIKEKEETNK